MKHLSRKLGSMKELGWVFKMGMSISQKKKFNTHFIYTNIKFQFYAFLCQSLYTSQNKKY